MNRYERFILIVVFFVFTMFLLTYGEEIQYLKKKIKILESLIDYDSKKHAFIDTYVKNILSSPHCRVDTSTAYRIASALYEYTSYYRLNPDIVFKMIFVETGGTFLPNLRGRAGEVGLMQLLPSTAFFISEGEDYDLYDIDDNIKLGCKYLRLLLDYSGGDYNEAIAKYNAGRYWRTKGLSYATKVMLVDLKEEME